MEAADKLLGNSFAKSFGDGNSVALSYDKNGTQDNAESLATE